MHLDPIVQSVGKAVKASRACEFAAKLNEYDRYFSSNAFAKSSAWIAERLKEAGCTDAEVVQMPADGKTRMQDWTMPLAWECEAAELRMVEPNQELLCSRELEPRCVAQWSAPTDGEVVAELHLLADDKPYPAGAFVLTDKHPQQIIHLARQTPPAAFISDYVAEGYPEHRTMWINALSEEPGFWGVLEGQATAPVFVIPPAVGKRLRQLLSKGPVKLAGRIDGRVGPGVLTVATAVTPGQRRDQEILVMAHGYEAGVIDNASGVAAFVEAATVLGELIRSGILPPPKRSIRWFATNECYGALGLYTSRPQLARAGIAGLYLDTVGDASRADYPFKLHRIGAASPSFANSLVKLVFDRLPEPFRSAYHWQYEDELPLADHMISDPMVGIPTPWLGRGKEFGAWHSSDDVADLLDETSMYGASFLAAVYGYFAAAAEDEDAVWLAENILPVLQQELTERVKPDQEDRQRFWRWALRRCVRSAAVLADSAAGKKKVEAVAGRFDGPDAFEAPPAELDDPDGARLVPVRKTWGTLTFESIPADRRQFGSPRWNEPVNGAWYLADGKRTIAQIATMVSLELDRPVRKNLTGVFRLAAEAGLCELKEV